MKIPAVKYGLIASPVFVLLFFCSTVASPISRIDIFDKSDNHLLFVTFDYDSTGKNTGRSVFTSDSTFLRSTSVQSIGTGTRENSRDFNDNPLFTTTINLPVANKTAFSTVDQFGLNQFGPSLSYEETSSNNFTVTQSGATVCREQYEFGTNGDLNRITILDKSGTLAWYALVTHQTIGVISRPGVKTLRSLRVSASRGVVSMQFDLAQQGAVRAELYTIAGRRASVLCDKKCNAGPQLISAPVDGANDGKIGTGTYIIRLTINGITAPGGKLLLER